MSDKRFSMADAADLLDISEKTCYRLAKQGRIRGIAKIPGCGRYIIDREEVEAFKKEIVRNPQPAKPVSDNAMRSRHGL